MVANPAGGSNGAQGVGGAHADGDDYDGAVAGARIPSATDKEDLTLVD